MKAQLAPALYQSMRVRNIANALRRAHPTAQRTVSVRSCQRRNQVANQTRVPRAIQTRVKRQVKTSVERAFRSASPIPSRGRDETHAPVP